MDWTKIIKDLIDSGLTQARIAELCGTGQSYISGLLRNERKRPSWELGNSLLRLHAERAEDLQQEAA
jgi:transcriptional regulator with XRE-family HTH domain